MSRVIKFRAWDLWNDCYEEATHRVMIKLNSDVYNSEYGDDQNSRYIVEQFTGLQDKNGTDIYEGDIVLMHTEWSGGYMSDEFGEYETRGVAGITASSGAVMNKCKRRDLIEINDKWEKCWPVNIRGYRSLVIGNIHCNPELL